MQNFDIPKLGGNYEKIIYCNRSAYRFAAIVRSNPVGPSNIFPSLNSRSFLGRNERFFAPCCGIIGVAGVVTRYVLVADYKN